MLAPNHPILAKLGNELLHLKDEEVEDLPFEEVLSTYAKSLKSEINTVMRNLEAYREVDIDDNVKEVVELVNYVELVQFHYEFIYAVLQTETEEEVEVVKRRFPLVSGRYQAIQSKHDFSLVPARYFLVVFNNKKLFELRRDLKKCFKKDSFDVMQLQPTFKNMARIKVLTDKFKLSAHQIPFVMNFPKDDIFRLAKTSPFWQDLRSSVTFKRLLSKEEIASSFKLLYGGLRIISIAFKSHQDLHEDTPIAKKALNIVTNFLYYGARPSKAEIQGLLTHIDPDMYKAFHTWNVTEHPLVAQGILLITPATGFDERIYVPRLFPAISKELILKEYEENTFNKIVPGEPIFVPDLTSAKQETLEDILVNSNDKIQIRILAPENLHLRQDSPNILRQIRHKAGKMLSSVNYLKGSEPEDINRAIVIHIHGGGFVSMTSSTHRLYLNEWVNKLNLIHFSIDYRLAPAHRYPEPLDDVWQAYLWIVNYCENILGIKNQKIILAGDSAGGNLAMALMLRLVKNGLKVPDGCFLLYPNLYVDADSYSPSYFKSLDHPMLPTSLLKCIARAYVPEGFKHTEDSSIAPMLASDELLEKMPPIRIIAGSDDPLYDDNWRLVAKLRNLNKNVKMIVHEDLPHAFLCNPLLKKLNVYIQESIDVIKELISLKA